jgi:hypothetical protein
MPLLRRILLALTVFCLGPLHAQEVDNIDFTKGKNDWLGDGKVVYVDASGAISETETPGSTPAIKVELSKTGWRSLKQKLRPKSNETAVKFSLQVKAEADFEPLAASKDYTNEDWKAGGQYVWSAEMYPKCDFLIRLKDDTWYYRPFKLPAGTWKTFSVDWPGLKARQREIELLFPPGEGTIYIKGK